MFDEIVTFRFYWMVANTGLPILQLELQAAAAAELGVHDELCIYSQLFHVYLHMQFLFLML